jgi:hypothetical protein
MSEKVSLLSAKICRQWSRAEHMERYRKGLLAWNRQSVDSGALEKKNTKGSVLSPYQMKMTVVLQRKQAQKRDLYNSC